MQPRVDARRLRTAQHLLEPQPTAKSVAEYPLRINIGKPLIFPVSCSNEEAASWFDLGCHWMWGFHMEEAISCFEEALQHQPSFCMAHWGCALAHGSNYNFYGQPYEDLSSSDLSKDMFPSLMLARTHTEAALQLAQDGQCTPIEAALVDAIQVRYEEWQPGRSNAHLEQPYAEAMKRAYALFPQDANVACVAAAAVMNLTPWQMWDASSGRDAPDSTEASSGVSQQRAQTMLVKTMLESGLAASPTHVGLCHLYVHLMEMSPDPAAALPQAQVCIYATRANMTCALPFCVR
jgi:hypothetical protein